MRKALYAIILIFFYARAAASEVAISPERLPGQDWEEALEKSFARAKETPPSFDSPIGIAAHGLGGSVNAVPVWPHGLTALQDFFIYARNVHFHNNPNPGPYLRKSPWFYPIDGCYARAAHVSAVAKKQKLVQPGKVYAFGHLRLDTRYASNRKRAYWSYHTAAAYRVGTTIYVLDPPVEWTRFLAYDEWIKRISTNPAKIRTSFCDSSSYSPATSCVGHRGNGAYLGHMKNQLLLEWKNLVRLGLSPDIFLAP